MKHCGELESTILHNQQSLGYLTCVCVRVCAFLSDDHLKMANERWERWSPQGMWCWCSVPYWCLASCTTHLGDCRSSTGAEDQVSTSFCFSFFFLYVLYKALTIPEHLPQSFKLLMCQQSISHFICIAHFINNLQLTKVYYRKSRIKCNKKVEVQHYVKLKYPHQRSILFKFLCNAVSQLLQRYRSSQPIELKYIHIVHDKFMTTESPLLWCVRPWESILALFGAMVLLCSLLCLNWSLFQVQSPSPHTFFVLLCLLHLYLFCGSKPLFTTIFYWFILFYLFYY